METRKPSINEMRWNDEREDHEHKYLRPKKKWKISQTFAECPEIDKSERERPSLSAHMDCLTLPFSLQTLTAKTREKGTPYLQWHNIHSKREKPNVKKHKVERGRRRELQCCRFRSRSAGRWVLTFLSNNFLYLSLFLGSFHFFSSLSSGSFYALN